MYNIINQCHTPSSCQYLRVALGEYFSASIHNQRPLAYYFYCSDSFAGSRDFSTCPLLDLQQLLFSLPKLIFDCKLLPCCESHLQMLLPRGWKLALTSLQLLCTRGLVSQEQHAFFFPPFCMLVFPFPLPSQVKLWSSKRILNGSEKLWVSACSSFSFFRKQNLFQSYAAVQEPPASQGSAVPPRRPSPALLRHNVRVYITSHCWHFPAAATQPHQGRAAFPIRKCRDAAGAADVHRKAGTTPAGRWAMGCWYCHTAFPSSITGSHVCAELSLKRLRTKLWEATGRFLLSLSDN